MLDSLSEVETLPKSSDDLTIPTKVAKLDTHLKFLQLQKSALEDHIKSTEFDRSELLRRAKEIHITTDDKYKIIEIPIYPKKRVDVEKLKQYPEKYSLIIQNIQSRIKDKADVEIQKAEGFISQADVKSVIKNKAMLAMVIPEQSVPERWESEVVRR
jgi:hypothetical protein